MARFELTWTATIETTERFQQGSAIGRSDPLDLATMAALTATPVLKRTLQEGPGIKSAKVPPPRISEAA